MNDNNKAQKNTYSSKYTIKEVYLWTNEKWSTINQRTVNGLYHSRSASRNPQQISYLKKGIRIEMTKDVFYDYTAKNELMILSMMQKGLRPSIDRLDNDKGYSIDNIQIIPLIQNITKDRISSKPKTYNKSVTQLRNRHQYLKGQNYNVSMPLVVDYYLKLLRGYKFAKNTINMLIAEGLITEPFLKANDYTLYSINAISKINKRIDDYNSKIEAKNEKEAIKNKLIEDSIKNKELINNPKYAEVLSFLRHRRKLLIKHSNDNSRLNKISNVDDRILNERLKNLAKDIIENNISIELKSIREIRSKLPRPTHRGISFDKTNAKYIAQCTINGKSTYLGRFDTEPEALIALNTAKNSKGEGK